MRRKQLIAVGGVAGLMLVGLVAALLGWSQVVEAVVIVLLGAVVLLLLDVRDRSARLMRSLEKLRAKARTPSAPAQQVRFPSADVAAIASEASAVVESAGDRVVAAMAMERLAGADRHQEIRRELRVLAERIDRIESGQKA